MLILINFEIDKTRYFTDSVSDRICIFSKLVSFILRIWYWFYIFFLGINEEEILHQTLQHMFSSAIRFVIILPICKLRALFTDFYLKIFKILNECMICCRHFQIFKCFIICINIFKVKIWKYFSNFLIKLLWSTT